MTDKASDTDIYAFAQGTARFVKTHEDGPDVVEDVEIEDVQLSKSDANPAVRSETRAWDQDTEFSFSLTIEPDTDRVTCANCGATNRTVDPDFMFWLTGKTLTCGGCSYPLGVDV